MTMTKLPRGLKPKIENIMPGIIIPGTDKEPIITISGRGAMIQYRLVSAAMGVDDLIENTYTTGDLEQSEMYAIEEWIYDYLPSLLQNAKIRHIIRFKQESNCFYDFDAHTLYGGSGSKEKKGKNDEYLKNAMSLKGKPCSVTNSEHEIIDLLTRTPNARYPYDTVTEKAGINTPGSMTQTWSRLRKYDVSILETFHRKNGEFWYSGLSQIWVVGEENENISISMAKIFDVVGDWDVVSLFDESSRQLYSCSIQNVFPEYIMKFFGLSNDFFDIKSMGIDSFVIDNRSDSDTALMKLMDKCSISIDAVWEQLRTSINENIPLSISASTYYHDTREFPMKKTDLSAYSLTAERLERSLMRVCSKVQELIENSCVGAEYFAYCDIAVKPDSIIDYIVALILICFSYCKGTQNSEKLSNTKRRYYEKLISLIRRRFNYCPPEGSNKNIIGEIRKALLTAQQYMKDGRKEEAVSEIGKINDLLNVLGYNDSNSLLPTSNGREL